MTNTLRTTWITVFSIVAMLVSSYASSSSIMMTNVMMSQMGSNQSACYHSDALADDMVAECHVVSSESHAEHTNMVDAQVFDSQCHMSPESGDCGDMMGNHCSGSDCCASVCSTVSYPIQAVQTVNPFISSFARFQSVTIGQKVARAQSLLRPPTA
ncbi:hypothetical protein [Vibrio echinoideorum]|uniref:Uncharacterized protein n=1 Tax=Vibrio echinoideorum TaxID=2100116 RepID=A0ABU9FU87_9VIBR|nr:hypothetical protein [Vibrio echinoideorum]